MYEGAFVNDKRTGKKTYNFKSSGYLYEGEWLNDKMNGQGKMVHGSGSTYVDEWLNNKKPR